MMWISRLGVKPEHSFYSRNSIRRRCLVCRAALLPIRTSRAGKRSALQARIVLAAAAAAAAAGSAPTKRIARQQRVRRRSANAAQVLRPEETAGGGGRTAAGPVPTLSARN
jgi:hypothetical protein